MAESLTITNSIPEHPVLDFSRLREEGINHIAQFCGTTWTDHNTHDPGITVLEALCYALTDLGYRASAPMENILAADPHAAGGSPPFQTAQQALTCEPVTILDYRKLIINCHEDILNAWVTKNSEAQFFVHCKSGTVTTVKPVNTKGERYEDFVLNGLYTILIQLDPIRHATFSANGKLPDAAMEDLIKTTYHAHRNLCEDLVRISRVPERTFSICADIQVEASADIDAVYARILFDVQHFLTPPVNRYTLQQLQEKKVPTEQIFDGPSLQNGFIDDAELLRSNHPETGLTIRTSDLINVILKVPGVLNILNIHLKLPDAPDTASALWSLDVPPGSIPVLSDLALGIQYKKSPIRFYKDQFRLNSKAENVRSFLLALTEAQLAQQRNIKNSPRDLPVPTGFWLDGGWFSSIQQELPSLYGTGDAGLPPNADKARRAKIKQLKAYLLLFDMTMSDYASILASIPRLLSPQSVDAPKVGLRNLEPVSFPESISDLEDLFVKLTGIKDAADLAQRKEALLKALKSIEIRKGMTVEQLNQQSRNRLFDHLLARYAENFEDYVLMMHQVYGGRRQEWEIIEDKNDFLAEYELLSKYRARALDYLTTTRTDENGDVYPYPLWNEQSAVQIPTEKLNVAGVVRRVARLAGIDNYRTRDLAKINYETFSETDTNGNTQFSFRVVDPDDQKILLSATTKYPTEEKAVIAMRAAINWALYPDGFERKVASNGKFYFNITNKAKNTLARRNEYFNAPEQMENAIQYLMDFLTRKYSDEGMLLFEHILLRPDPANIDSFLPICTDESCATCEALDPYSFRVSVVLPGWTPRFTNMDFRVFFERTLRTELPAHVLAKVCWVKKKDMEALEKAYRNWLDFKHNAVPDPQNQTLNELIKVLMHLHSLYPPGTLHDCEEDQNDRPIVLGRSHLGTMAEVDLNPDDDPPIFDTNNGEFADEDDGLPIFR